MPADYVVEDFVCVDRSLKGVATHGAFDLGVETQVSHDLVTDSSNDVTSSSFINQFNSAEDLEKIKMPVISHDEAETNRRKAFAQEIFDGILDVRIAGIEPYLSLWDTLSVWMGVEGALYALADEPEFMLELSNRIVAGFMSGLDQLEAQGLLCEPQSWIHCTGAWTDDLPGQDYNKDKPQTKNIWMYGLAQMFSTVSPPMFKAFEIDPCMPLYERFGLVYYGCCDPLDRKMNEVRLIPNLRKVSMSPWADMRRGAEAIGRDYVLSCKPNPAMLAVDNFDEDALRSYFKETMAVCKEFGCPLELILKDISTVRYKPQNLWRWVEIAMACVNA